MPVADPSAFPHDLARLQRPPVAATPPTHTEMAVNCPDCGQRAVFTAKDGAVECPNGHVWVPPGRRR